jgi:hypothetical protein
MAAQRYTRVAARLVRILREGDCAIVGGLAVNAYGYVRATRDVDLIVALPLPEARRRLAEAGLPTKLLRGDILDRGFDSLKGVHGGVPFDVLPPLVPLEAERTVVLEVHGLRLPVVDFETLVRLKLRAGGPRHLLDLAMLVNLRPERRERTLGLAAAAPDVAKRLLALIDDPRVIRDARERVLEDKLLARPSRQGRKRSRPKA